MDYVITNIRLYKEDYERLKTEAAKKRKSLSAIIREKISTRKSQKRSPKKILEETRRLAKENAKYLKGFDIVKALREMRYEEE